mmetsp:Transcript_37769/g.83146  ORF Transcript_37769/g.83146 Transcript_37769/m.83146 type:complete len:214 (-) Transcript_37769:655-1296(-)
MPAACGPGGELRLDSRGRQHARPASGQGGRGHEEHRRDHRPAAQRSRLLRDVRAHLGRAAADPERASPERLADAAGGRRARGPNRSQRRRARQAAAHHQQVERLPSAPDGDSAPDGPLDGLAGRRRHAGVGRKKKGKQGRREGSARVALDKAAARAVISPLQTSLRQFAVDFPHLGLPICVLLVRCTQQARGTLELTSSPFYFARRIAMVTGC